METQKAKSKVYTLLVAIDFSSSSARALRMAQFILGQRSGRIAVIHVIDDDFVKKCIENRIGTEKEIKKTLFLQAKQRLAEFLEKEGLTAESVEVLICEGTPFLEINKKAVDIDADMVIMGNRGNSGDMRTIFFGSTTERVLRFMSRPVLCVPATEDRKS